VVSIIQATFSDMGPTWQTAFGAADLIYDPNGSYPDLSGYSVILVDTSDMWWSFDFAADEAVWTSYHADGGCVWVVGQDYLYSRGYITGFPMTVLGLAGVTQDVAWSTTLIDWEGDAGGPLDGLVGQIPACFAANGFFTDDVAPATQGLAYWSDETGMAGEAGCVGTGAGLSTLEFACGGDVGAVAARFFEFCGGPVPVEESSWGHIKALYR
jgi:hypothetical protein